jgi:hypothetical protein
MWHRHALLGALLLAGVAQLGERAREGSRVGGTGGGQLMRTARAGCVLQKQET